MIFYFTGNGNSRWVAEQLAVALHECVVCIFDCLQNPSLLSADALQGAESVGLVFPVHSWRAPRPVYDFLSRYSFPAGCYRYAVCTCGDDAGRTMNHLSRTFPLDAAWSVRMPNTYIPMFALDDESVARQKIALARQQIPVIASAIAQRRRVWQVYEGMAPRLKTYLIHPLFTRFVIRSRGFHTDAGCVSCGACVANCPVGNIRLVDGHPEWGSACIHCMACVHGCPQRVIQYRKATQKRGRYRLTSYLS